MVRSGRATDARDIVRVHVQAVRETCQIRARCTPDEIEAWAGAETPESVEEAARNLECPDIWHLVAQIKGRVAAYGAVARSSGDLGAIYVEPAYAGRGLGVRLLAHLENLASSLALARLNVDASLNSELFFAKRGYILNEYSRHSSLGGADMTCARMSKRLPESFVPVLETRRLRLRPVRHADAPRIQKLLPHYEILRYMSATIEWPYPDDAADRLLNRALDAALDRTSYFWALTINVDARDQLIGVIALFPKNAEHNRAFWIGLEYQKQGLMTEAVGAVNDFAFDVVGMSALKLKNAEPNIASNRLKQKSGAVVIDTVENVPYFGGRYPEIVWLLTKENWRARRASFLR